MNVRTVPKVAIDTYLRVARAPLDLATSLLPGNGGGPRGAAQLALDRTDAVVRTLAGSVLGDEEFRNDARHRREAVRERARAAKLHAEADRTTARAEEQVRERHQEAQRRRQQADQDAKARRE